MVWADAAPAAAATGRIVGHGGQCLTAAGTANGSAVTMQPCGADGQSWTTVGDGTVRSGDRCLDIKDYGTGNGTRVQPWDCAGSWNQAWSAGAEGLPNAPDPDRPTGVDTVLYNAKAAKCLDVEGFRTAAGTPVQLFDCAADQPNQQWKLPTGRSFMTFRSSVAPDSGPRLCMAAVGRANGTPLTLQRCGDPGAYTEVTMDPAAYRSTGLTSTPPTGVALTGVEARIAGKCIDIKEFAWAPNAQVQLWDCAGSANQHWTAPPVTGPISGPFWQPTGGRPSGAGGGPPVAMCAAVNSADRVELARCANVASQRWTRYADGTIRSQGRCMDAVDFGATNGTRIQVWDCSPIPGNGNQKWLRVNGDTVVGVSSGRCLDALDYGTAPGTPLQLWDCAGSVNQRFRPPGP